MRDDEPSVLAIALVAAFLWLAFCMMADAASSQSLPEGQGVETTLDPHERGSASGNPDPPALLLARICKLEAESGPRRRVPRRWRLADCDFIYHKAISTWGDAWLDGLLGYTKLLEREHSRGRRIASLPDGDIPGASKRENLRWAELRQRARDLIAGKRRHPCPEASHWGGTMDIPPSGMVPATCAAQQWTANALYRVAP